MSPNQTQPDFNVIAVPQGTWPTEDLQDSNRPEGISVVLNAEHDDVDVNATTSTGVSVAFDRRYSGEGAVQFRRQVVDFPDDPGAPTDVRPRSDEDRGITAPDALVQVNDSGFSQAGGTADPTAIAEPAFYIGTIAVLGQTWDVWHGTAPGIGPLP